MLFLALEIEKNWVRTLCLVLQTCLKVSQRRLRVDRGGMLGRKGEGWARGKAGRQRAMCAAADVDKPGAKPPTLPTTAWKTAAVFHSARRPFSL